MATSPRILSCEQQIIVVRRHLGWLGRRYVGRLRLVFYYRRQDGIAIIVNLHLTCRIVKIVIRSYLRIHLGVVNHRLSKNWEITKSHIFALEHQRTNPLVTGTEFQYVYVGQICRAVTMFILLQAILIGHQGKAIKKLGIEARKDIEEFTGKRCFLSLHIKVLKDWRNSDRALKSFGYAQED